MSIITKSLSTDFSGSLNTSQLEKEINWDNSISNNCISVINFLDVVQIYFDNTLSSSEETALDTIISNHVPNNNPLSMTETLDTNESKVFTHFMDPDYLREIKIRELLTDTYDDSYKLNSTTENDYNLDDSANGSFNTTSYSLTPSNYIEGSNIAPNATAFASSSQQPASNGNDNSTSTIWYNLNGQSPSGSWWAVDFGEIVGIIGAEIVWHSTTYYATIMNIEKSNDGENWTLIESVTGIGYTSLGNDVGSYKFPLFSEPAFGQYFRFVFNSVINSTYVVIREGRLFSANAIGYSTTASPTINNIFNNRQIDTEIWNTINSSTIVGSFPANTSTNILLSFDNQNTWRYWNGSSWQTSSLANIATTSMSHTVFNALTNANYHSSNGINS